jgi:hypothetical protein
LIRRGAWRAPARPRVGPATDIRVARACCRYQKDLVRTRATAARRRRSNDADQAIRRYHREAVARRRFGPVLRCDAPHGLSTDAGAVTRGAALQAAGWWRSWAVSATALTNVRAGACGRLQEVRLPHARVSEGRLCAS